MKGFEKIEKILESFLGEPKNGFGGEQLQFNCPACTEDNGGEPDGKHNLEVNLRKGQFLCWKCSDINHMKGNLGTLIKRYGGRELYKRYREEINSLIKSKLYDLDAFVENIEIKPEKPEIFLPKTYKKINLNGYCKTQVREYLQSRNIDQSIVDKFNLGYTEWEPDNKDWSYRIIIPSYNEFGDLNFYVGRDYTGNGKRPKYKNCDVEKKGIIFQESLINWDADITLVEGAIDCIYGPNTFSMLGKTLSEDTSLYQTIKQKANGRVIICLDNDTSLKEVKKIYNSLNFGRLKDKIWYIRLDKYKDFGELYENFGKSGIISAIHGARQFKEIDLIFE